jgi:hypothetical protein
LSQKSKNQPKRELYNRNNLKTLDEKVRSISKEASPYTVKGPTKEKPLQLSTEEFSTISYGMRKEKYHT